MESLVIGLDLGATNILYGLANMQGKILYKNTIPTQAHEGVNRVLDKMTHVIQDLLDEYKGKARIKNIVLASPGPLSYPEKIVFNSPNLKWDEVALEKEMQTRLQRPVMVEKDTNIAVLGEYYFGGHDAYNNLIYITVSTGIGLGIIINGQLYRGATGGAGELGHMVVAPHGPVCGCAREGCLESVASGTAIAKEAHSLGLFPHGAEGYGSKEVGDLARQGDKLALAILDNAVEYLAIGIANYVNIFNPALIVLGGGVMLGLEDLWFEKLKKQVMDLAFPLNTKGLRIELTKLGGDVGLYGCVAAVLNA